MKQKKNPQELKQVVRFYIYSIKERGLLRSNKIDIEKIDRLAMLDRLIFVQNINL